MELRQWERAGSVEREMQGGGEPPSVGSVERDAGWRGTPLCGFGGERDAGWKGTPLCGFGGEGCRVEGNPPCGVAAMLLLVCGLEQQTCFTSRLCGFGPR